MMHDFLLKSRDGLHQVIVRAKCLTCARSVAANEAGREGPRVWRDPEFSTVELLRAPGHTTRGR